MNTGIHEKLISAGWRLHPHDNVTQNSLNTGIQAMYLYKDNASLRFHEGDMLRLLMHSMNNTSGFQIEFNKDQEKIIDAIIAIQDKLSPDDYFGQYMELQNVCDISILAIEQFL